MITKAKYIIRNEFCIANIDIDRTNPKIQVVGINNINLHDESYENTIYTVYIEVKITDKNLEEVFLDNNHLDVKVNDKNIESKDIEFFKTKDLKDDKEYKIVIKNIKEKGKLKVEFIEGTAVDREKLKNKRTEFNTILQ